MRFCFRILRINVEIIDFPDGFQPYIHVQELRHLTKALFKSLDTEFYFNI